MRTAGAIAKPSILPLRPEKKPTAAKTPQPFITIRLSENHKSVLRRFARLRVERGIPRNTVLDLFECHAEAQEGATPVFYLQVLMPILDFEVSRLAGVEKFLDSMHVHELVFDRNREIIEYRINRDGEHEI